ncbi:hypothetical protein PCANC_15952 [Puccinia coronata f. sp. avenae]|uniref:Uncharacterized protein n=1 Tax=Puccinia coronata f. sp. avenae TaxID=200324 RepID=A0A2N5SMI0_9BASI|nr:hypothetical protein PCANC_15952 [Puccinia coronata f. sp. avenae]
MSSIAVYPLDGFSMYLMPRSAAPVCPPCQSDLLPSVFEDDDDKTKYVSLRKKVNRALRSIHSPKFLSPITRLRSLTLSRRSSRSTATDSLPSTKST